MSGRERALTVSFLSPSVRGLSHVGYLEWR